MQTRPNFLIIAGVNGAGKTTLTQRLRKSLHDMVNLTKREPQLANEIFYFNHTNHLLWKQPVQEKVYLVVTD